LFVPKPPEPATPPKRFVRGPMRGCDMSKERETAANKIVGVFHDALGLPPGDKTPHGEGRPDRDPKAPHGGLTSDDPARRDGAPVDRNSGADE
jgi:hypothetical protein